MMAESIPPMLPGLEERTSPEFEARWFAPFGCVVYRGDNREVYVGVTVQGPGKLDRFAGLRIRDRQAERGVICTGRG